MESRELSQRFLITYIQCRIYSKYGSSFVNIQRIINEDKKKIKLGQSFEEVVEERKRHEGVCRTDTNVERMPCGACKFDKNHYPILKCDYCDSKFTEASVPGFC